jgi:hypothetical protein
MGNTLVRNSLPALIHVYTVRLLGIEPVIWRRIEVPEDYSFYELHVAIQDAMGWLDYHLHEFRLHDPRSRQPMRIGLPDDEDDLEPPLRAGWKVPIKRYFKRPGDRVAYGYDFGDNWQHDVQLTAIALAEPARAYPRCADGARACPPEDCGGIPGYEELLRILADAKHPERRSTIAWLKGHAKNYHPYRPDEFDPAAVAFMDPAERFRMMLE